ncbi:hypothetical protein J1605_021913 [Eschrichtius robustus]|uniref:Uncharacterized protein n=1 Tax=Eschrichtius robustus TaxID=9764 RepID=A0AB34H9A2_ESCRO|nr:hypothetical protein J1605_021913 [Eschrichtius robustus]
MTEYTARGRGRGCCEEQGKVLPGKSRLIHWPEPAPGPALNRERSRPTAPSPPPSAPAFPDGIRARFRPDEAPCLFMLHAFLPRASSVSTQESGFQRAQADRSVLTAARTPARPRFPRPSSPRESPGASAGAVTARPGLLKRRGSFCVTR